MLTVFAKTDDFYSSDFRIVKFSIVKYGNTIVCFRPSNKIEYFRFEQKNTWRTDLLNETENDFYRTIAYIAALTYEKMKNPLPNAAVQMATFLLTVPPGDSKLNRKNILQIAEKSLIFPFFQENYKKFFSPLSLLDQVRVILQIGEILASEIGITKIAQQKNQWLTRWNDGAFESLMQLNLIASFYHFIHHDRYKKIPFLGKSLHIPDHSVLFSSIFPQILEWKTFQVPDTLLEAHRYSLPKWTPLEHALAGSVETLDSNPESDNTYKKIARSLIDQAERNKRYLPNGQFILKLPSHLEIKGVREFFILVDSKNGFWFAPYNAASKEIGHSAYYSPHRNPAICNLNIQAPISDYLELLFAALWHDMLTAGNASLHSPKTAHTSKTQTHSLPKNKPPEPVRRIGVSVRILPSPLKLERQTYQWGSPQEREYIQRRLHAVRGFLRHLPAGQKTSPQAHEAAAEYGFILPPGYTFVRPHMRGSQKNAPEQPVRIYSKGLATITYWLASQTPD